MNKIEEKICRRCSKPIELVKSCGQVDCPFWNPRDMWGKDIKNNLGIKEIDKHLVENLCNRCSDCLENALQAFYNCKTVTKDFHVVGGHKGKWESDNQTQIIKIWEVSKIWEFDLKENSLENILNLMNF